jgi:hypothetical protein
MPRIILVSANRPVRGDLARYADNEFPNFGFFGSNSSWVIPLTTKLNLSAKFTPRRIAVMVFPFPAVPVARPSAAFLDLLKPAFNTRPIRPQRGASPEKK